VVTDDIIGNYSTISDTSESKSITTSPFTVTTNRDDIIDNLSTISETRETKSSTTNYLVTEGKNKHFCIKKTCFRTRLEPTIDCSPDEYEVMKIVA
jgi:hypothetical protein